MKLHCSLGLALGIDWKRVEFEMERWSILLSFGDLWKNTLKILFLLRHGGDEPLNEPEIIDGVVKSLQVSYITLCTYVTDENDVENIPSRIHTLDHIRIIQYLCSTAIWIVEVGKCQITIKLIMLELCDASYIIPFWSFINIGWIKEKDQLHNEMKAGSVFQGIREVVITRKFTMTLFLWRKNTMAIYESQLLMDSADLCLLGSFFKVKDMYKIANTSDFGVTELDEVGPINQTLHAPAPEQASSQLLGRKRKIIDLEPEICIPRLECNRSLPEGVQFVNNMVIEEPEYGMFFIDFVGDKAFQRMSDVHKVDVETLLTYLVMASTITTPKNQRFCLKLRKLSRDHPDQ
ncbi:hypothetical protein Tco_0386513 [Tanacetum coccineum]